MLDAVTVLTTTPWLGLALIREAGVDLDAVVGGGRDRVFAVINRREWRKR